MIPAWVFEAINACITVIEYLVFGELTIIGALVLLRFMLSFKFLK